MAYSEKTQKAMLEDELKSLRVLIRSTSLTFPDRVLLLGLIESATSLLQDGSAKNVRGPAYIMHLNAGLRSVGYVVERKAMQ